MILSDTDILKVGPSIIEGFDVSKVKPNSYDVCLSSEILIPIPYNTVDLRTVNTKDLFISRSMNDYLGSQYVLPAGKAILGSTIETVNCPSDLSMRIEGKSTIGRLFMIPHVAASGISPGFKGQITLEIVNLGPWGIVLYPGMPIAQLFFEQMVSVCSRPYGHPSLNSKYQDQNGPTPSSAK